jgi:hypothetical protein
MPGGTLVNIPQEGLRPGTPIGNGMVCCLPTRQRHLHPYTSGTIGRLIAIIAQFTAPCQGKIEKDFSPPTKSR